MASQTNNIAPKSSLFDTNWLPLSASWQWSMGLNSENMATTSEACYSKTLMDLSIQRWY